MVLRYTRLWASQTERERDYVRFGECGCTDEVMCDWCYYQANQD